MSRISSYAVNTQLISRFLRTQNSLLDYQGQVDTGKKSQTYSGISTDSQRLVNLENTRDRLQKYISNNQQQETRLSIASTTLEALQESMSNFKTELANYSQGKPLVKENVDSVQAAAFRALRDMEDLLNTEVDGRYIFGGSRATTTPINFNFGSVAAFQSIYDGATVKVPETRDAHLASFSYSNDKNNEKSLFIDDSSFLQFSRDGGGDTTTSGSSTIRATSALFSNLTAGATITVADTTSNNGTYTVDSVSSDGTTVTVRTEMLTDEVLAGSLTSETPAGAVTFLLEGDTGGSPSLTSAGGTIAFNAAGRTITASGADVGLFNGVAAGDYITIAGSGGNNVTVQVESIDATDSIITIAQKPTTITLADNTVVQNDAAGNLTFNRANNTITAANNVFSGAVAGDVITVEDSDENAGTYTIASVSTDGKTVTIVPKKLTDEGVGSGNTFLDLQSSTLVEFTDNGGGGTDTIHIEPFGGGAAIADIFNGLVVGDTVTFAGTTGNNTTYTINAISADGSTITVDGAILAAETANTGATVSGSNSFAYTAGTQMVFTDVGAAGTDTIHLEPFGGGTAVAGAFSNLVVGERITASGTATSDGTYTITAISSDGSTITVAQDIAATDTDTDGAQLQVFAASGTISATSFYGGDSQALSYNLDDTRSVDFDIQANDPAFEKAIRAMKLILQGEFGTEGGLDQNLDRVSQASYLISSALETTVDGTPPFGTEESGSIEQVSQDLGFAQYVIDQINAKHTSFIGFLEKSISNVEDANPLEAITRLLDQEQSLNASYQAFARVRQLSLTNFL